MGGFGSGGWNATGRPTTASLRCLNMNVLNRDGVLRPGWTGYTNWMNGKDITASAFITTGAEFLSLTHISAVPNKQYRERLPVSWEACRFGGRRPFFHCPSCGKRCLNLYCNKQFKCRVCHGLSYPSQRHRGPERARQRANRVRMSMGGKLGCGEIPERPV
jgi:hypothetical protein